MTGLVGIETEGLAEQLEHSRYDAGNDVFDFVIRKHGQKHQHEHVHWVCRCEVAKQQFLRD